MVLLTASLPSLKFAISQIARLSNFNTNKKTQVKIGQLILSSLLI